MKTSCSYISILFSSGTDAVNEWSVVIVHMSRACSKSTLVDPHIDKENNLQITRIATICKILYVFLYMQLISMSISYQLKSRCEIKTNKMCEMLCLSCVYAVGIFVIALEEFLQCWGTWGFYLKKFKMQVRNEKMEISTWYQVK